MKAANTGCETSELTISLESVNKAKPDMKYAQLGGYVCVCVCVCKQFYSNSVPVHTYICTYVHVYMYKFM